MRRSWRLKTDCRSGLGFCGGSPSPVHSAHVGQQLEVHYRWHPYFGSKVAIRRVEQRATGQFLLVLGPAGVVVSMAGWMLDPVIGAGMTFGGPRVDLAALVELERLLIGAINPARCRSDVAIVPEEGNAISQSVGGKGGSAADLDIRQQQAGKAGSAERDKIISALAQILMQAAGLSVEELDDDKR